MNLIKLSLAKFNRIRNGMFSFFCVFFGSEHEKVIPGYNCFLILFINFVEYTE